MYNTDLITRLFAWVLHHEMELNNVNIEHIIKGIEHMKEAYKHKPTNLKSETADAANFITAAYRCAYIHKFAPLHTVLVSDILQRVVTENYNYFHDVIGNSGSINICSLGGGPCTDILGLLLTLYSAFGFFQVSSVIIDCMPNWNATVDTLIRESQTGNYGEITEFLSAQYFQWMYIGANLLEDFSLQVEEAISSANIINMIKFISAAVCVNTEEMIRRIFDLMKPGAMAFFIDNSVGEIKHLMSKVARDCELQPLYGPINHEHYINKSIGMYRFGYPNCMQTKIAIQVWLKPNIARRIAHSTPKMCKTNQWKYLSPITPDSFLNRSNNHSPDLNSENFLGYNSSHSTPARKADYDRHFNLSQKFERKTLFLAQNTSDSFFSSENFDSSLNHNHSSSFSNSNHFSNMSNVNHNDSYNNFEPRRPLLNFPNTNSSLHDEGYPNSFFCSEKIESPLNHNYSSSFSNSNHFSNMSNVNHNDSYNNFEPRRPLLNFPNTNSTLHDEGYPNSFFRSEKIESPLNHNYSSSFSNSNHFSNMPMSNVNRNDSYDNFEPRPPLLELPNGTDFSILHERKLPLFNHDLSFQMDDSVLFDIGPQAFKNTPPIQRKQRNVRKNFNRRGGKTSSKSFKQQGFHPYLKKQKNYRCLR